MGRAVSEDYEGVETLLLGRVTYDSFVEACPDREAAGGDDAEFAALLADRRKIVVSRSPLEFTWRNSEPVDGDPADRGGEAAVRARDRTRVRGLRRRRRDGPRGPRLTIFHRARGA
ncbi:MAG: hypothetical protein ABS81_10580 [Pseudonocardia sp. SCN 72-86]|nr:MAG: hypothetical protein ABS81_10580 [Pseudonocardia sp. SCN 72-86]